VAYDAGGSELEVGGDWYDAFWLDEGRTLGLVVGDVVGRGLDASATMGQLRSAVRALASTGLSPSALLEALDGYARRHDVGGMTTLVYAELDLQARELRFASAGHLPPLVAEPGEAATMLWEGRSVPLDSFGLAGPREIAVRRLAPGSAVMLYTDGLVERRDRTLDDGLEALCGEFADHRDAPAEELAETLLESLCDPEHADDVCVLALRLG
jgi:serine/threonine-protein kinase RsbW